jgi:thiosulfate dehydrogenase [quinone] large subunit
MTQFQKVSLFLLRVTIGWYFLNAGIAHLKDPGFAAATAGYLGHAQLFSGFYGWLASPSLLPIVAAVNAWGLTILGLALVLGAFTRWAAYLGAALMALYYLPLGILHPDVHSFIVDDHIIYIAGLLTAAALNAGRSWGIDGFRKT